ncbi:aspartate aminotransferase family protein, partial [Streptomyces sp. DJ]
EGLVENAAAQGERLLAGLREVAAVHPAVADVRGLGLMCASEFTDADGRPAPETAAWVRQQAEERDLLLLTCGAYGNVVRMIPPLVVTGEQVDRALEVWAEAVAAATVPSKD